jgi:hypothetical protein
MTEIAQPLPTTNATLERERLLRLLALTAFIIFFQATWPPRSFRCFQRYCRRLSKLPD